MFESHHIFLLTQLLENKYSVCCCNLSHLFFNLLLEILIGELLHDIFRMIEVIVELLFSSVANEGVAATYVEINVG